MGRVVTIFELVETGVIDWLFSGVEPDQSIANCTTWCLTKVLFVLDESGGVVDTNFIF
jgi:glyceraldehyde-3-phosphate dehydrogenase/erythrose-4-phosphate dehydrogenase